MSPRLLWLRLVFGVLLVGILPQIGRCADGDEPSAAQPDNGSMRFRRIFTLEERLREWASGPAKYMPMDAAEFERLVKLAQDARIGTRAATAARIVTAEYHGRLQADHSIEGTATFQVELASEQQALMPLQPCGLAISNARWTDPDQADASPAEATMGLGVEGELALLVDQSAVLQFDWSLVGREDASQVPVYRFALPGCPTNRLILEVPDELTPTVDRGIVEGSEPAEAGLRRWTIALGGYPDVRVRMVPADASPRPSTPAAVRESVTYDFSLHGVDVSSELQIQAYEEPISQVVLAIDRELQLATARYGDLPVAWSVVSEPDSPVTKVALALPEPIRGAGRVLRVGALAPLRTGRPWRLPRIRAEQMFWEAGEATLLVPVPLVLKRIAPVDGRQSGTGPLSAPRTGESARFQYFSPNASLEVVVDRRETKIKIASGTAVVLGEGEIRADVITDFQTSEGSSFSLEADVAPHWIIDSVASSPTDNVVEDWTPLRSNGSRQKLTVRLSEALSPTRPIRLTVSARRLNLPLDRPLALEDLVPLRFRGQGEATRLVSIQTADTYRLKTDGTDRPQRLDPHSLDAPERERLGNSPGELLFEDDAEAADLRIAMEPVKPSYTATVRVEALVAGQTLQENYTFRCQPESARVERVVVHFSAQRETPMRWTLGTENGHQLAARKLSIEEQVALGFAPDEETWEVVLARSRSEPFEIRAVREFSMAEIQPISLASLPEATGQRATLMIRSLGPNAIRIQNTRLRAIPAETVPPDRYPTLQGAFRYDPLRDALAGPEPAVSVSVVSNGATPLAWAWSCHLESRYEANGTAQHLATYHLENAGAARLRLTLPPSAAAENVHGVWLDEDRVVWRRVASSPKSGLAVDLPAGKRFPTVTVHFSTTTGPLGTVASLQPPMPQIELPVLLQYWSVWLPPGYASSHAESPQLFAPIPVATWQRRLLGPLGRSSGQDLFDPLSIRTWSPAISRQVAKRRDLSTAEQLLRTLGKLPLSRNGGANHGNADWGWLLGHSSVEQLPLSLLVDRYGLDQLGLTPQTAVRPVTATEAGQRGAALLSGANLALLIHGDLLLVTSQANAALYRPWLEPLVDQVVWQIVPGPLADRLAAAAIEPGWGDLLPVATWKLQPPRPQGLWRSADEATRQSANPDGWTAYRLATSEAMPAQLTVVHRPTIRLLGSVTLLLVIAVGWWKARQRTLLLVALAGGFGVAALLVPAAYVPIASGAVLGTLFCLALRLIGLPSRTQAATEPEADTVAAGEGAGRVQVLIGIFVAVAALVGCGMALGADQPDNRIDEGQPIYRVFVPVDKDRNPTGGKYQVPLPLYDYLHRHEAASTETPQGWLIGAATYRGELAQETTSGRLVVEELKASFDLQVFGLSARVRIPLQRGSTNLLPDGVLLDGRPIQPEWEPSGEALAFDVPEPGRYRLELRLRPTIRTAPDGFDLAIPRVATARLELGVPATAPTIEVPSALGPVRREEEPSLVTAELGPCDQLSVRWRNGSAARESRSALDVEELFWLNIKPGAVVVDARLRIRILEGEVQQFRMSIDPDLELRSLTGPDEPKAEVQPSAGGRQTVLVRWPQPRSGTIVLDATFLVTDASGVGNARMPLVAAIGVRPTRRWLAVSVDPVLEQQSVGAGTLEAVAVPDFVGAWGNASTQPLFAYRLDSGDGSFSIATRPHALTTSADESLRLSFDRDRIEVLYDAALISSGGYAFQHRLSAPPGLRIDKVSVLEGDTERVARWSQESDGTLTVFLAGPVTDHQTLLLRGSLPWNGRNKMPLPTIHVIGARLESSIIRIYRRPAVLVSVDHEEGLSELENPLSATDSAELGRLVRSLRIETGEPSDTAPTTKATLSLRTNQPQVSASQVTRLVHDGGQWKADVDCHVEAAGGVVDVLHLEAPASFGGPYTFDGTATIQRTERSHGEPELLIRPQVPIAAGFRFRVAGPLGTEPGDRFAAPRIALRQANSQTRYLLLPREVQGRSVDWETRGLKLSKLPDALAAEGDDQTFVTYEVVADAYQALLKARPQANLTARVRLADIRVAWRADDTCYGVATFDVEPGAATSCPLHLPVGYRLIQVTVAGVPTTPMVDGPEASRLPLGPEGLAQRVAVVFSGTLAEPAEAGHQRFDAPRLGDLPVDQTLWTIAGPTSHGSAAAEEPREVAAWQHNLTRLTTISATIDTASKLALEDSQGVSHWYRRWIRRLVECQTTLQGQLALAPESRPTRAARATVLTINDDQSRVAARLGLTEQLNRAYLGASVADDVGELWRSLLDDRQTVRRFAYPEGMATVTLALQPRGLAPIWGQLLQAAILLLLVGLTAYGLHCGALACWFQRWPYVVVTCIGIAWWLWLSPSVLGWGIILLGLLTSVRSGWRRPEIPSSAVISVRPR